jgi:hypothetical protein
MWLRSIKPATASRSARFRFRASESPWSATGGLLYRLCLDVVLG